MPGYRPRRGAGSRQPGRKSGRTTANARQTFQTSRLDEREEPQDDSGSESRGSVDEQENNAQDQDDVQSASEEEDEGAAPNSYLTLLQSFHTSKDGADQPPRKKRRTENGSDLQTGSNNAEIATTSRESESGDVHAQQEDAAVRELEEEVEQDEVDPEHRDGEEDSGDEFYVLRDPFEQHYAAMTEQEVKDAANEVDEKQWQVESTVSESKVRRSHFFRKGSTSKHVPIKSAKDLFLKARLSDQGAKVAAMLSPDEKSVASDIFKYADVIDGNRTLKNAGHLRDLSCLHALNHVFKTRDRVLKNNTKLSAPQVGSDVLDLRDQGFTRPKVLIIVPTKQACVRFVDNIVKLSEPDQQENKARFLETFSHQDPDEWPDKPEDFRQLFGGNHEEDFRIGLKFTRKTIKYFSGFYNSDIIIGSPLGLMRTITTGGGGKDKKKTHDADFLSSIEVIIVDHANALQMQNWQHVEYVFSQLNLLPKDSHGCDFSRVRHWYLDGQAKYLRQTIIFSDYLTPEINALASTHLHNISGRTKSQPTYPGVMLSVSAHLPTSVSQTFLRFPAPTALQDSDARFKYFTTTILPPILRDTKHSKGILVFVPSYLDFVRLRNHLSTSADATNLSFGSISEYTPRKDVLRARSHFLSARHGLLLYSERAHHHFRYQIKGVRKVFFYGVPENPLFWLEVVSFLALVNEKKGNLSGLNAPGAAKNAVRALFSKWDAMKLERVVGTDRVARLIMDRGGDVFDFV